MMAIAAEYGPALLSMLSSMNKGKQGQQQGVGGVPAYQANTGATGGYGGQHTVQNLPNPFADGGHAGGVSQYESTAPHTMRNMGVQALGKMGSSGGGGMSNMFASSPLGEIGLEMHGGAGAPYAAERSGLSGMSALIHRYLDPVSHAYQHEYQHPGALLSKLGGGYQASPGHHHAFLAALQGANAAAAAGGMSGTLASQQQTAGVANQVSDRDYQEYLHNALGVHSEGLGGWAQTSGTELGDLAQFKEALANLASQSKTAKQHSEESMSGITGGISDIF